MTSTQLAAKTICILLLTYTVAESKAETQASTNEPCEAEFRLLRDMEDICRTGDAKEIQKITEEVMAVTREWWGKTGVTPQDAAELLKYVAAHAKTELHTRIEVRWSDGNRGVVTLVHDGSAGYSAEIWCLFKYKGLWREFDRWSLLT